MSLQHVVLFSFPDALSDADSAAMRAQVASWPAEIGGMTKLRFGADLTGARTRGYCRLLYMEFAGTEELARYQSHPVHQAFHNWVMERQCTPLAFDYFINEENVLVPEDRHEDEEEER